MSDIFPDKLYIVNENGTISYESTKIEVVLVHALENIRISSHSVKASLYLATGKSQVAGFVGKRVT